MSASNRAALIGKLQTALKKHYKPAPTQPTRPLLEHVLYASLLEDAPSDLADEGMAKCEQEFFDWNEVRVTTVTELAQVLSRLPDPVKAAHRMKSNLQGIFEEFYTFDLDHLKKENLGKAVNKFEKMSGMTPFVLSYTIQHGLGGHSIPIDYSAMVILLSTEIASQPEAATGKVPGLERAIPKNKGIEFSGLLHQAAVDLNKNTKDTRARAMLDAVSKGSSDRLDEWLASRKAAKKRAIKRKTEEKAAAAKAALEAAKHPAKKKVKLVSKKKAPVKPPLPPKPGEVPAATPTKKSAKESEGKKQPKTSAAPSKKTTTKSAKKSARKTTPIKKSGPAKKKSPGTKSKKKAVPAKKAASKKTAPTKPARKSKTAKKPAKKSSSRKLTKRKPR